MHLGEEKGMDITMKGAHRQEMVLEADIYRKLKGFELNVQFQAKKGCLGILGASGCGKSMTLKSVAGIIRPDRGKILLSHGEEENPLIMYDFEKKIHMPSGRRGIGYVFQNYALFPNMTVEENIGAGLKKSVFRKKPGLEKKAWREIRSARVRTVIEQFQLSGLEKRYPSQLSGGQQQRVALARSLAYEPDVLLLDEPFSAMDGFLREEMRQELGQILNFYEGIAILVTHDKEEAFQLCGRLLLLYEGRVLAEGDTKELFSNPKTVQAARLIGCENISRIQRIGAYRVKALDWGGLKLAVDRPVGDDIIAVGIHSHAFEPFLKEEGMEDMGMANIIPVKNPRICEMPLEWQFTLENGLRWKQEKRGHTISMTGTVPPFLALEPSDVFLLEEG
ncbi:ATP-binding cassette domain-containing protein [Lachnospiraceae bacterium 62-35]